MIRTAIFAGAVLNLMACGQPDAANDRNDETRSAGAPTAAQQILEVDTKRWPPSRRGRRVLVRPCRRGLRPPAGFGVGGGRPGGRDRLLAGRRLGAARLGRRAGGRRPGRTHVPGCDSRGTGRSLCRGNHRVLYWRWSGVLLHQWTPTAPGARELCALNGRPAVALQEGVALRGDDGETVAIGGQARTSLDLGAARWRMESSELRNTGYSNLFMAADGRLVVTTIHTRVAGALLDRATGCWTLLKENPLTDVRYVGMVGDSVVTAESSREPMETRTVDGRRVPVFSGDRTHIFVRPVRAIAGEPCF